MAFNVLSLFHRFVVVVVVVVVVSDFKVWVQRFLNKVLLLFAMHSTETPTETLGSTVENNQLTCAVLTHNTALSLLQTHLHLAAVIQSVHRDAMGTKFNQIAGKDALIYKDPTPLDFQYAKTSMKYHEVKCKFKFPSF